MEIFATRLKELREDKNISIRELARILDINKDSLSRCERGVRYPTCQELIKFANYFNVTTDYLLGL